MDRYIKCKKKVKKIKIENINLKNLKPYKNNAKIHTKEQVEQIKKSIEKFGMNDPIGIWGKENIIVEGHGRLEALKQLGYNEVPCIRLDHLTDGERKAYTLTHNKLTMNTDFDFDIMGKELKSITDIDMSDFGFELDDLLKEEKERNDLSDSIKEKYEIIIECKDDSDLEQKYNKLISEGYECRIST